MINFTSQSGCTVYGVNGYVIDTAAEISNLPTDCAAGSRAKVIETGDIYIFNSSKEWIKQPVNSGTSGTGEDDIVVLNDNPSSANDDILIL